MVLADNIEGARTACRIFATDLKRNYWENNFCRIWQMKFLIRISVLLISPP